MATTTEETKLRVSVDDRDIKQVGRSLQNALDPRVVREFERSMQRSTQDVERMGQAVERLGSSTKRLGQSAPQRAGAAAGRMRDDRGRFIGGGGRGPGGGGGAGAGGSGPGTGGSGGGGFWPTFAGAGLGSYLGSGAARIGAASGSIARGQGMFEQLFGSIPIVGGALSGAIGGAQDLYQLNVAERQAAAGAFGQTGTGRLGGFRGAAAQLGIAAPAAYQSLAQISQQTGIKGQGLFEGSGAGLASTILQQQKLLGVNTGSLLGAAGTAGGRFSGAEGQEMVQRALEDGLLAGFREARLQDYLQQIAGEVQTLRTQGIMIEPGQIQTLVSGFAGLGASFQGEAGAAAARRARGQVAGAIQGGGMQGQIAMRAARSATGRDLSYFEARDWVEKNPAQSMKAVQDVIVNQMGLKGEAGMFLAETMLPGMSVQNLRDFVGGKFGGGGTPEQRAAAQAQLTGRAGVAGAQGTFARAAHVAGRTNRRAALGGQVAGTVETMQDVEDRVAAAVTVPLANLVGNVAEEVEDLIKDMEGKSLDELGSMFGDKLKDMVNDMLTKAVDNIDIPSPEDVKKKGKEMLEDIGERVTSERLPTAEEYKRQTREMLSFLPKKTLDEWFPMKGSGKSPADDLDAASQHLGEASRKIREQETQGMPAESDIRGGR